VPIRRCFHGLAPVATGRRPYGAVVSAAAAEGGLFHDAVADVAAEEGAVEVDFVAGGVGFFLRVLERLAHGADVEDAPPGGDRVPVAQAGAGVEDFHLAPGSAAAPGSAMLGGLDAGDRLAALV